MSLPTIQDPSQNMMLLQQKWKTKLDPLFNNSLSNGKLLTGIALSSGVTTIAHGLGSVPKGWFIVDIPAAAVIFRSAPLDATNLVLTSNAVVTVSLWVF